MSEETTRANFRGAGAEGYGRFPKFAAIAIVAFIFALVVTQVVVDRVSLSAGFTTLFVLLGGITIAGAVAVIRTRPWKEVQDGTN